MNINFRRIGHRVLSYVVCDMQQNVIYEKTKTFRLYTDMFFILKKKV